MSFAELVIFVFTLRAILAAGGSFPMTHDAEQLSPRVLAILFVLGTSVCSHPCRVSCGWCCWAGRVLGSRMQAPPQMYDVQKFPRPLSCLFPSVMVSSEAGQFFHFGKDALNVAFPLLLGP